MNQTEVVKNVSRSFALSLLWLPKKQRSAVAQTYLLARFADTIVDCGAWSLEERLAHLERWENAILQNDQNLWKITASLEKFTEKEARFLNDATSILKLNADLSEDQKRIGVEVVKTLISGMKWD